MAKDEKRGAGPADEQRLGMGARIAIGGAVAAGALMSLSLIHI